MSVVAYVRDYGRWVGGMVESVLQQRFEDLELFVLDDGSTDDTADAVRRYARDPRLRYERQEPRGREGLHETFNRCLEEARGELVAVANGDDEMEPGKLERQVALLDARPEIDVCFHDAHFLDDASRPRPGSFARPVEAHWLETGRLGPWMFAYNLIPNPTVLFRRSLVRRIGVQEYGWVHDYQFWLKAAVAGARFCFLPERLLRYRVHGESHSTSSGRTPRLLEEAQRMRREMRARYTIDDLVPEVALCADPARARALAHLELAARLEGGPQPDPELAAREREQAARLAPGVSLRDAEGSELARLRRGPALARFDPPEADTLAAVDAATDPSVLRALLLEHFRAAESRALVFLTADPAETQLVAAAFASACAEIGVAPERTPPVDVQQVRPQEFESVARGHLLYARAVRALGGGRSATLESWAADRRPRERPHARLSFCIISDGGRPELLRCAVESIRAQGVPEHEIVVAGRAEPMPGVQLVEAGAAADAGRLGELRNRAVAASRYEHVVMLDDDMILAPGWYEGLRAFGGDFDILTCRLRLPDGGRYWDHATCGARRGQVILDPEECDDHVYMTGGGAWIMKRRVGAAVHWDATRGFYESEDVDFAARCRFAGFRIAHNPSSLAYHLDPRCTTIGRRVHRRAEGRDVRWVERELPACDAVEILRRVRELVVGERGAEAADALRYALATRPEVEALRSLWESFERVNGGALREARWVPGGDPELHACLRGLGFDPDTLLARCSRAQPAPAAARVEGPTFGVNVFGFLSGNLGLGQSARNLVRWLRESGIVVCPVEMPLSGDRQQHDARLAASVHGLEEESPWPVNLFVANPPDVQVVLAREPRAARAADRVNLCLPFWELPLPPASWVPGLEAMDVVLAASRYVEHALLQSPAAPRVRYLPQPLYVDEGPGPQRAHWGFPDDACVFVTSFEMASDLNRKNPFAAIEAFSRAFGPDENAQLVIKINNAASFPGQRLHLDALTEAAWRHPGIRILDAVLPYGEVLSLYASADVVVSLHRAEWLGLLLLEGMALGKPVLATGWSGNMDFMDDTNACLVGYRLVPVRASTQAAYAPDYTGSASWADPSVEEAARWMRRLAEEPELRERLGKRAGAAFAARHASLSTRPLVAAVLRAAERRGLPLASVLARSAEG